MWLNDEREHIITIPSRDLRRRDWRSFLFGVALGWLVGSLLQIAINLLAH